MTWQTPPEILALVRQVGRLEFDPCTAPDNPTKATFFATEKQNGLALNWTWYAKAGLAFVNPPYGRALSGTKSKPGWAQKIALEARAGCPMIVLVPARTDTAWWNLIADSTQAVCFWRGRISFVNSATKEREDPAPFPCCFFYTGKDHDVFEEIFSPFGRIFLR